MATATLGGLIAAARQLIPPDPDADLLRRFAATRDDGAFAALVARYGRLVLSACRRIVPDTHLADDAFQATFVVLATKAASLDGSRPLGPWLYAVASHVATRARAMIGRRRKRETLTGTVPDVPDESSGGTGFRGGDDRAAILDEEIGRLSAACRDAVVLCELQGLTRKQAAAKLGIAEGTLSSRLAAARKTLASRLRARGVVPTSVIISAIFVPTDLVAATVAVSTGTVDLSPQLTALVQKGLAMTLIAKLKLVPAVVALGLLLLGAAGWGGNRDEAVAAPVPKAGKDEGLIWTHHTTTNALTAYTPEGKKAKEVALPAAAKFIGFTPDGARMMFVGMKGKLPLPDADGPLTLHVGEIDAKCEGTDTGLGWQEYDEFVWSPDGKQVVRARRVATGERPLLTFSHTLFDVATKKETAVELPARHQLKQWSADGKTWRVMHYNRAADPKLPSYRWFSMPAGGGDLTPVCDDGSFLWLDPHPDGKRLLGAPVRPADDTPGAFTLATAAGGKLKPLAEVATEVGNVVCAEARWSPDGERMVAVLYACGTQGKPLGDTVLAVFDGDGKEKKTFLTLPADGQQTRLVGWFPSRPKAAADPRKKNAPVPKAAPPEGVILVSGLSHKEPDKLVEVLEAAGKSQGYLKLGGLRNVRQTRVSPDGKRLAFIRFVPLQDADPKGKYAYPEDLYIVDLPLAEPPTEPVRKGLIDPSIAWAADGKSLLVSSIPKETDTAQDVIKDKIIPVKTVCFDPATKTEKAFDLPEGLAVQDVSPDGKTLLARVKIKGTDNHSFSSFLVPLDTLKPERIGDEDDGFASARFSPDGTRIAGIRDKYSKSKVLGLFTLDLAKGKIEAVPLPKGIAEDSLNSLAWAPNSKRLALLWQGATGGPGTPGTGGVGADGGATSHRITVLDADGGHAKMIREYVPRDWHYQVEWADPKRADAAKPAAPQPRKNAPVPKADADPGLIWVHHQKTGKLVAYTPDGKTAKELDLPDGHHFLGFTPDGTRILFAGKNGKVADADATDGLTLHLRDISAKPEGTDTGLECKRSDQFVFSPDGKRIVRQRLEKVGGQGAPKHEHSHVLFDVATKKETKIDVPTDCQIMQWTPDGKAWRVLHSNVGTDPKLPNYRWLLYPVDGGKPTPICDDSHSLYWLDPSPDGVAFVACGNSPADAPAARAVSGIFVVRANGGKVTEVKAFADVSFVVSRWSVDATRIACMKYEYDAANERAGGSKLLVFDADGKNEKTLLELPDDSQQTHLLGWFPTKSKAK